MSDEMNTQAPDVQAEGTEATQPPIKVTRKEVERQLYVSFPRDDEEAFEHQKIIRDSAKEMKEIDTQIDGLKSERKLPAEKHAKAISALERGKLVPVMVEERYEWENKRLIITRLDTNEIIETCELDEQAYQIDMSHEVVE